MDAHSDLSIDTTKFGRAAISAKTNALNEMLMDIMSTGPKWYEVGAPKYREMRAAGETPLPKSVYLDSAEDFAIPSRDAGRDIPCRILRPQNGKDIRAVFLHIHGGGWVLGDEKSQDSNLQDRANRTGVLALSVGYRLAPEHPFPAGPNDCYDVAEWLVDNATSKFGAPLGFVGGESAGAHLSMLVALHLMQHSAPRYAEFRFKGLLLHFGCYSMVWTPGVYHFQKRQPLVLDKDLMDAFRDAFLPGTSESERMHPSISPLYANLELLRGKLPAALYTCGTEDCLLDDTMFMSTKWLMAGGEAIVKIIPGAPHGYLAFPRSVEGSGAAEGLDAVEHFILSKLD
ncbi:hypothetical protein PV08_00497 [Exophiala spinifera]|uniref:Alpha/beta hydrolase fold-3 domain-containing protein n=1 Tax=Exophiala spinifera TaxID=91928 RepID=A0A0D2A552_9EURO|nr:uncharacterized protein PV08_00497 [Exophiala spinifera]KIW19922.1 hypothetical protein PV08_00497 [Exophiala spinifera]